MTEAKHKILLLGGPPGSGKTALARRLSARFHMPHLEPDFFAEELFKCPDNPAGLDLYRVGYDLVFTLAPSLLKAEIPCIVDANMGRDFSWEYVARLKKDFPDLLELPLILECPREICSQRLTERFNAATRRTFDRPGPSTADDVVSFLAKLSHPRLVRLDSTPSADKVFEEAAKIVAREFFSSH